MICMSVLDFGCS